MTKGNPFIGKSRPIVPIKQEKGGSILGPLSDKEIKEMNRYYKEVMKSRPVNCQVIDMTKQ